MTKENKIIFIGPMGAGKSTAISTISDEAPVATEARNSNTAQVNKATTTVAMDYGRILLDNNDSVHLYGIPGQQHFSFIWPIVAKGALGAILLLDCSQSNWKQQLLVFLQAFESMAHSGRIAIALNRSLFTDTEECFDILSEENIFAPVFNADPRNRDDVLLLLQALIANAESEDFLDE
ncbi:MULTISPECIES: ATP/GTP-binding protein [unclassified Oceanobacter]|uniref:GTP-binding protein n=1 Tax=unclassified Oceanobacter TaxID=2620260 RepID=UPI0026E1FC8B|nr:MULTISPECIES: ATP/GTP-binding protein [unclassified Oceanobacter]MDO6683040.1 ATP/GTP-binding protein [Oceanobacter sp. 5_MG-2023]MDP2507052.1 ATP/GTP-binding protein [Oceanobacter sp. 3_MG-2023]MDP2548164.1 ATP/GTP-binding protein [Oceanobacter sp. 4_MG-2023]MDP2609573.1 ATP/GTP-binding protein [Oceanobacter sp. 1_MG-2023]MDP2612966.1 ATP/GTP-binding protein [Oceanobacter sp. 2_MG-2023]